MEHSTVITSENKVYSTEDSNNQSNSTNNVNDTNNIRYKGICRWFNDAQGYGFIKQISKNNNNEEKKDIFVHQSSIMSNNYRTLFKNEFVEYNIRNINGRISAVNVTGPNGRYVIGKSIIQKYNNKYNNNNNNNNDDLLRDLKYLHRFRNKRTNRFGSNYNNSNYNNSNYNNSNYNNNNYCPVRGMRRH